MMTFQDGPAKNAILDLARAPYFLRVVIDAGGKVDALDQPDDTPRADETPHVYVWAEGRPSYGFACSRGRGCRPFASMVYRLYDAPPAEAVLRDDETWKEWARTEAQRLGITTDGTQITNIDRPRSKSNHPRNG